MRRTIVNIVFKSPEIGAVYITCDEMQLRGNMLVCGPDATVSVRNIGVDEKVRGWRYIPLTSIAYFDASEYDLGEEDKRTNDDGDYPTAAQILDGR